MVQEHARPYLQASFPHFDLLRRNRHPSFVAGDVGGGVVSVQGNDTRPSQTKETMNIQPQETAVMVHRKASDLELGKVGDLLCTRKQHITMSLIY